MSDFQNYRHDHGPALRLLADEAFEIRADLLLHHARIRFLFSTGSLERSGDSLTRGAHEIRVAVQRETAAHNLRQGFDLPGQLVDGNNGEDDTVFGNHAAIA